ncbi:protein IQ-DOMAIN 14-like [Hibiscus syriacus]|uniref:protein IQ-DOMAIN 14-like n=1 Tax=Hibiscus syriacus TaxID=106335 RepID=UPI001921759A|nr:protein IQ-DOMAIN 14-like [Hibiscus syriacus]
MGKKGGWFSAIKRVFVSHSKEKLNNSFQESDKKDGKGKKKKIHGKYQHGETNSFIPLFREPSSIEKILGEAERDHKIIFRPPTPPDQQRTPPFVLPRVASPRFRSQRIASPRAVSQRIASPPRAFSHRAASPLPLPPGRAASPRAASPRIVRPQQEPTLRSHHASATKIQAAFRGYLARRNFRALKGLVRLQGVVRGHNVKRQTITAMKYMQLLVRVQSQIQSRRIQMLENQARRQTLFKNDNETESAYGKWTFNQASEAGNENWDDSVLSKEEIEERMQRRVEAVIKRERAMAYAYSHQLWKDTTKSPYTGLSDIRPWWWNWLERQVSPAYGPENQAMKTFQLTPSRPNSELKPSPRLHSSSKQQVQQFTFDNIIDIPTPKSTRSTILPATRPMQTPPPPSRLPLTPQATSSGLSNSKRSRSRGSIGVDSPMNFPAKDDNSLTSCPPFSVPSYMAPTVSAKAKVRANSNSKERFMATPGSESNRRLSFPLTQGIGSFKWGKGSLFSGKDSRSQTGLDKRQSLQSLGNLSVDSTVSMPATVGRKPFNRFV